MRKCPYCAEMVQDDAKICRYCNKKVRGRFKKNIIILIAIIGIVFFVFTHKKEVDNFFYKAEQAVKSVNSAFRAIKDIIFDLRDGVKALKDYKNNRETIQKIPIND